MTATAATTNLATALAAFQAKLPSVRKNDTATVQTKVGGSYKYSYAGLAAVNTAVLPLLGAVGLSFSAKPTMVDGKLALAYRLLHTSGEEDCGVYPLPQVGTPQEIGSAITYARRYALCSVVGVAPDEDDDGAAASTKPMHVAERPPPQWDPVEQDVLVTGWLAEIDDAADAAALTGIGQTMKKAVAAKELSPASYDKLKIAGAARRAELDAAAVR